MSKVRLADGPSQHRLPLLMAADRNGRKSMEGHICFQSLISHGENFSQSLTPRQGG